MESTEGVGATFVITLPMNSPKTVVIGTARTQKRNELYGGNALVKSSTRYTVLLFTMKRFVLMTSLSTLVVLNVWSQQVDTNGVNLTAQVEPHLKFTTRLWFVALRRRSIDERVYAYVRPKRIQTTKPAVRI